MFDLALGYCLPSHCCHRFGYLIFAYQLEEPSIPSRAGGSSSLHGHHQHPSFGWQRSRGGFQRLKLRSSSPLHEHPGNGVTLVQDKFCGRSKPESIQLPMQPLCQAVYFAFVFVNLYLGMLIRFSIERWGYLYYFPKTLENIINFFLLLPAMLFKVINLNL